MNKIEHTDTPKKAANPKEGQFYYLADDGNTYLLARVAPSRFSLVNLSSGGRWTTDPEYTELGAFGGQFKDFVLVASPFTIVPNN